MKKTEFEIWLWVVGYKGYYKVSNFGGVKSVDRIIIRSDGIKTFRRGKILKPFPIIGGPGYLLVDLRKGCEGKQTKLVHRLVLETFVGPCPKGMEARHFPDRDPSNCRLDNLGWATKSQNELDKRDHGTHNHGNYVKGEDHFNCKITDKQVIVLRKLFIKGDRGYTRRMAEMYNVSETTIRRIITFKERV